jgi:hypothetical protein
MACNTASAGVGAKFRRGENVLIRRLHSPPHPSGFALLCPKDLRPSAFLPTPLAGCGGFFAAEGFIEVNLPESGFEVGLVFLFGGFEVTAKFWLKGLGQGDYAVFSSLAIVDGDGALTEVDIFDPEPKCFHLAESTAIHELSDEPPRVVEVGENLFHFFACHDDGGTFFPTEGRSVFEFDLLDAVNLPSEKHDGV